MRLLIASLLLAAPALAQAPGTGWSRAGDLQVYAAFDLTRDLAKERSVLCYDVSPAKVERRWRARWGAREDAVEAALERRYGRAALDLAEVRAGDRVSCGDGINNAWRDNHKKLLRLLERRVAGYGSRG